MFRHMLVPLDGSRLAEAVLPVTATLALALDAQVTLLHVVEPGAPPTVHGDVHLTQAGEADGYLRGVAEAMAARGVRAAVAVGQGADVAGVIASRAAVLGTDLIVLCTHGRGGVRALLFGRVAEQVLARGTVPVLLMAPTAVRREQVWTVRRLLVPLDGSAMAEAALPAATALARALAAEVALVMVVPTVATIADDRATAARLMPTAGAALLDVEAEQAVTYLQGVKARLEQEGVRVAMAVERGEPVRVLLDRLAGPDVDLLVMATHGRSGVSAVWAGSVASRLVARSPRPVLLIRIPRGGDQAGLQSDLPRSG